MDIFLHVTITVEVDTEKAGGKVTSTKWVIHKKMLSQTDITFVGLCKTAAICQDFDVDEY